MRYAGRSDMWIWRRLKNDPDFPKPFVIGNKRFWRLSELTAYEDKKRERQMMRQPPDERRGPRDWQSRGLVKLNTVDTDNERNSKELPVKQGPVLTAIPISRLWRLKAINFDGETVVLPGVFHDRLQALGAAVLLAENCKPKARVVP